MKTIKKLILILGIIVLSDLPAEASHYMGGEITWECLPNGRFRFIVRVYRECAGVSYSSSLTLNSNSPAGNIVMFLKPGGNPHDINDGLLDGRTDMSPNCNPDPAFPHIKCSTTQFGQVNSNAGAVEEWFFTSEQNYPTGVMIDGVPPPTGWVFSYSSCCRNPCTNIAGTYSKNWFLRAIMYPYNNTNTYPCWDDSPTFHEMPTAAICTGYPFTYNHNAYDKQLDSLAFEWATPLETSINTPITGWNTGYSYTSPLPSAVHNMLNVPATVNPYTGEVTFTSYTQGAFVLVTKVTAYKCGIKIAEVFREIQTVLLFCGNNQPPSVSAPFYDSVTGSYILYVDTVYAGAVVDFYFSALDTIPLVLANGNLTSVTLTANGSQFGNNYTSTTAGCLNPPCATLSPPPPITNLLGINTTFQWQTSCDHLEAHSGCGGVSNVYHFILKTQDDFCPIPGVRISTITVVVLNAILDQPNLQNISVEPNGDVILNWDLPDTSKMSNTFDSYHIYSAINPNGPYVLLDSIFSYGLTTYTHVGADANNVSRCYYLRTRSGCHGNDYSGHSDTLSTLILSVENYGNTSSQLNQPARIFIPNAFSPQGYNTLYKPITDFVDLKEYFFSIYNRWGQKVFETRDPESAWDGTYNGAFAPGGVYVYFLRFLTRANEAFEKRGTVTLFY